MPCQSSGQVSRRLNAASSERADHAHGAGFGRRGEPHEDGAEHEEDQDQRRHHAPHALRRQRPAAAACALPAAAPARRAAG